MHVLLLGTRLAAAASHPLCERCAERPSSTWWRGEYSYTPAAHRHCCGLTENLPGCRQQAKCRCVCRVGSGSKDQGRLVPG
eukprot:2580923-Pleurochrysis_carterae.AAC.7